MKPGYEIKPLTFKGKGHYRVQLGVSDYREAPKWNREPVKFWVTRLNNSFHRNTPFSAGDQMYYGAKLEEAVVCIEAIIQRLVWPCEFTRDWHRYAKPESQRFRDQLEEVGMRAVRNAS